MDPAARAGAPSVTTNRPQEDDMLDRLTTTAIGAALLLGALAQPRQLLARPNCSYTPDVALNAGLVAGEPKAGLLYLAQTTQGVSK